MTLTWLNLIVLAAVAAILFLLLGTFWNLIKKFLQIWLVMAVLLVGVKLAMDQGWL